MAAQRVDARIERRVGALGGFGRERASDQGGAEDGLGAEQAGERVGSRKLRAVEQREPFLRAEVERGPTRLLRRIGGGDRSRIPPDMLNLTQRMSRSYRAV